MVRGVHLLLLPPARDELSDAGLEHVAGGLNRGSNHLRGGRALKGTPVGHFPTNRAVVGVGPEDPWQGKPEPLQPIKEPGPPIPPTSP